MSRILFVTHEASRTGAPIAVLTLLQWLKANSDIEFEILIKERGELEGDFAALGTTHVLDAKETTAPTIFERVLRNRLGLEGLASAKIDSRLRRKLGKLGTFDAIYINGVTCSSLLRFLPADESVLISHIHELSYPFKYVLPPEDKDQLMSKTKRFVACSQAVKDVLVSNGADPEIIQVCYEFIREPAPPLGTKREREEAKSALGLDPRALVVGGAGVVEWRKGDKILFAHLAAALPKSAGGRPIHMLWIGGQTDANFYRGLMHEMQLCGVEDRITITGLTDAPGPYFDLIDVLALTSREDPFPLVCLEAAAAGKPIVCFDSGGMKEFVGDQAGEVVAYPNVEAMKTAILRMLKDEGLRKKLGAAGRRKVGRAHGIEHAGPRLLELIEATL